MAKILVIDDDDEFRNMLKQMLERGGHHVITATDGDMGIEFYRKEQTDLVITDLIMPKKEGVETIIELKKESPNVKIIAMSGGGLGKAESYLDIVESLNIERTFSKPLSMSELLGAVKELT